MFSPQSLPRDITPLIIAQHFGQPDGNTGGPSEDSGEDIVDDQEPKLQRRCNLKGRVSTNLKLFFKISHGILLFKNMSVILNY